MGVFTVNDALRAAAIDAGHELGVFEALGAPLTLDHLAERAQLRPTHRLVALIDALVALGALARDGSLIVRGAITARSALPMSGGWGAIADVIRADTPLAITDADIARRYQRHLVVASAPAARDVAEMLVAMHRAKTVGSSSSAMVGSSSSDAGASMPHDARGSLHLDASSTAPDARGSLSASSPAEADASSSLPAPSASRGLRAVDIGGGAGAYTRALLAADPHARVTLVDMLEVIDVARRELADLVDRVDFVAGDARELDVVDEGAGDAREIEASNGSAHDAHHLTDDSANDPPRSNLTRGVCGAAFDLAIVANVLHLHAPSTCAELCASAARSIAPGGIVAIVDLRRETLEGEMFALNMALYTDGGRVYSVDQIGAWLREAGLDAIEERRIASAPEMVVVLARRPHTRADSVGDGDDNVPGHIVRDAGARGELG